MQIYDLIEAIAVVVFAFIGGSVVIGTRGALIASVAISAVFIFYDLVLERNSGKGFTQHLACIDWHTATAGCPEPENFEDFLPWTQKKPPTPHPDSESPLAASLIGELKAAGFQYDCNVIVPNKWDWEDNDGDVSWKPIVGTYLADKDFRFAMHGKPVRLADEIDTSVETGEDYAVQPWEVDDAHKRKVFDPKPSAEMAAYKVNVALRNDTFGSYDDGSGTTAIDFAYPEIWHSDEDNQDFQIHYYLRSAETKRRMAKLATAGHDGFEVYTGCTAANSMPTAAFRAVCHFLAQINVGRQLHGDSDACSWADKSYLAVMNRDMRQPATH